jgi:hypothetical protein
MFSANVCSNLIYESELGGIDVLKANPLRNSPAMFVLRFLFSLPSLMKNEAPTTTSAKNFQEKLKILIEFATERKDFYFIWSVPPTAPRPLTTAKPDTPKVILLINRTG